MDNQSVFKLEVVILASSSINALVQVTFLIITQISLYNISKFMKLHPQMFPSSKSTHCHNFLLILLSLSNLVLLAAVYTFYFVNEDGLAILSFAEK